MNRFIYWPIVLLLPLGVAGMYYWLPVLDCMACMLGMAVGATFLLVIVFHFLFPAFRKENKDFLLVEIIMGLFFYCPVLASLLILNQSITLSQSTHRYELMQRFVKMPGEPVFLFFWTGNEVIRYTAKSGSSLEASHPGDSLDIHAARGILGLEYIQHVDRTQ